MEEENIHLQLVTPNEHEDAPSQIMEADEDDVVQVPVTNPKSDFVQGIEEMNDISQMGKEEILPDSGSYLGLPDNAEAGTCELKCMPAGQQRGYDEDASDEISHVKGSEVNEKEEPISDAFSETEGVPKSPLPPVRTEDRFTYLETAVKRNNSRLDGFSQELKILLVEVNIVCEWITDNFGVELIDKASQLFKHIHDHGEVEEMFQTLSLLKKGNRNVRRSARRKPVKPKRTTPSPLKRKRGRGRPKKKPTSDSDYSDHDADEVEDGLFDPPECVLNTDIEEDIFKEEDSKPKRKRVRKRAPKKVFKKEVVEDIKEELREDEDDNNDGKKKKKWKAQPRSLQCEECGKILKADSSLRWHMLMHADLRPVECTEPGCGKTFRDKSKLAQHQKIHNGEKSEKCRYCDRGFLRKKDLIVHERTHTGEKPYACPSCPKTFNIKDHLTIHLRVHTGERPYKCPTCDKAFSQANSLRIHKKIHLKQASDFVPAIRKPRAPRKTKSSASLQENHPSSPTSNSIHTIDLRNDLEEQKPINLHDGGGGGDGMDTPSPVSVEPHSSLVQTFFQAQTLNLVDPVQHAWNFVTTPNAVAVAAAAAAVEQHQHHHHQQQPHQQHHQPQHTTQHVVAHQRSFNNQALGALSHLSVVQGHTGGTTTFKIQPITYHTHPQQHQQQQTQQHPQSINIIRNPLSGQGGPFVPTQFHDPSGFRHFPTN